MKYGGKTTFSKQKTIKGETMNMKLYGIRHISSGRMMAIQTHYDDGFDCPDFYELLTPNVFHENDADTIFLNSSLEYVQRIIDNLVAGPEWEPALPRCHSKPSELEILEVNVSF